MGYRDEIIARLDVLGWFASQGIELTRLNDTEYRFRCPFHDDRTPSANVAIDGPHKAVWFCHGPCNRGGSVIDLLMELRNMELRDAMTEIGRFAGVEAPTRSPGRPVSTRPASQASAVSKLTEDNVTAWHEAAKRNHDLMLWFHDHRGYTDETISKYQLGWDGYRVTIPIRDERGQLVNIRRYKRDSAGNNKFLGLEGCNEPRIWPLSLPLPEEVVICEGEWDTMIARQHGIENAVTVTSGAGIWEPHFTPLFEGRTVSIIYDNDDAGAKGRERVGRILSNVAQVRLVDLPLDIEKGDVTDWFVAGHRSAEELRTLIQDAPPYIVAEVNEAEPDAVRVPLHLASDARWHGTRQEIAIMLSGKAMTPYTIPFEFEFTCPMNNRRFCGACPMLAEAGHKKVKLNAADPAVLALISVTSSAQQIALRALAKAHPQCTYGSAKITSSINVEELRLIAELDEEDAAGEREYVSRTGYFLGHGLLPNRSYRVFGYAQPHPKTQSTVHVISQAEPSQDNISSFKLTPEITESLRVFEADEAQIEERWESIYDDLRTHVHRIQGRLDMQTAYDLTWHSVTDFTFNGAYVRRGWIETMIMGDSGQGKTEMAMGLLRHYRLGERVQGEQASVAGLMGGLEKMGDSWMLSWGRLPLNDRRLLIVDETQGLRPEAVESLSDCRATGVAEITKIRTERTHARVRVIWLANPPTGRTLNQHNQGVTAISELFRKPEDIRRLDFAVTVASGDVDYARQINVMHEAPGPQIYTSDLCRNLLLWIWSRRSDQIDFLPEATRAILGAATAMSERYHPSVPLVEPADQRLKLARLAVAAAARLHSCDETGERIVVRPEHVAFVVRYLDRVYNAASMSYGEYSDQRRSGEVLTGDEDAAIREQLQGWTNADDALRLFRQMGEFKKSELMDVLGWTPPYAAEQIKYLAAHRMIHTTRNGYRKNAVFIGLLRSMLNEPIRLEPAPGEAF